MKTLVIRRGLKITIRAIATEAEGVDRDKCETLAFFQEQKAEAPDEMIKLTALLSDVADHGPPHDETKFKKLDGTDGLYEFKARTLRLICFWDDGGIIVCSHGYVKGSQKAPKYVLRKAERTKKLYDVAKENNTLIQ
jgi:hypothetical protein